MSLLGRIAVFAVVFAVVSCGGDKNPVDVGGPSGPAPVATVTVSPAVHTVASLGATVQFQAVARDASNNTVSGVSFAWGSSDPAVVTVDGSSGLATTVGPGDATISASADGVMGTATLTVGVTIGESGGVVSDPTGSVTITIPDGALPDGATITIEELPPSSTFLAGLTGVGPAIALSSGGVDFDQPVQVVIAYTGFAPEISSAAGVGVVHFALDSSFVEILPASVDPSAGTLTVSLSAFSGLQILAPSDRGWIAPAHHWTIGTVKWYLEQEVGHVTRIRVADAFALWGDVVGGPVFMETATPGDAQISISVTTGTLDPCVGTGKHSDNVLGVTCLGSSEVSDASWDTDSRIEIQLVSLSVPDESFKSLAHEIGHALGLEDTIHELDTALDAPVMQRGLFSRLDLHPWDVQAYCTGYGSCVLLQPSELCSDFSDSAIATFESANLAAAIRAALGVGAQEDLACGLISGLTILNAFSAEIGSLVGIQNLAGLTELGLTGNSITDIGLLSQLTSLARLYLHRNSITDIGALSGLTSLTDLGLGENSITDISALSGLTSLTTLTLSDNSITDVSALGGLLDLTVLILHRNSITDISALSGLTSLTTLTLSGNSTTDIGPLSGLTSLTSLTLRANSISDISALSGLTGLRELRLSNNSITDIRALSGYTSLLNLSLDNNPNLTDIQPLLDNVQITVSFYSVDLRSTSVSCSDVLALKDERLFVSSDCVFLQPSELCRDYTDEAFASFEDAMLEGRIRLALSVGPQELLACGPLSGLTVLNASTTIIESLVGIQNLTSLTVLYADSNLVSDVSPLSELTSLTTLDLSSNHIIEIGPLSGLTSLTNLDLRSNLIENIGALSGLTSLTILDFSLNSVADIGALSGLTGLTSLFLTYNSVTDVAALSGLTSLTLLGLDNNPNLSNIGPLLGNTGLGTGDSVFLRSTMVSCPDIDLLIAKGVTVFSDCPVN